ncbi:hypothetical protein [Myxococcus landrumensis]|uniref:Uncharacterized protein n=1 Tax=Myxococcus landrumensis TaxID=2813577 RepID=A0ABX7NGH7_9BACT|nr:hypothetical protein [Myxococcus landrumus]QSQ17518.1 hypothetical protein JY572_16390 [Myxococcus landrumus]
MGSAFVTLKGAPGSSLEGMYPVEGVVFEVARTLPLATSSASRAAQEYRVDARGGDFG